MHFCANGPCIMQIRRPLPVLTRKVQIGEPGFPISAVSRQKQVTVGMNQSFQVGYHDFSKLSLSNFDT